MLLVLRKRRRALHFPVAMAIFTLVCGVGAYARWTQASYLGAAIAGVFFGITFWICSSSTRWISAENGHASISTLYGQNKLVAADLAIGIRVSTSTRSAPTYTVYAQSGSLRHDLSESMSEKRAERQREKLSTLLLGERGAQNATGSLAQQVVNQREQTWRNQHQHAREVIASYYKSSGHKKTMIIVAVVATLYTLGTALFLMQN